MDQELIREYRKQRQHYTGSGALRAARINLTWEAAEEAGLVRLHCEPECDLYDDSYIDTWNISESRKAREKKELWSRIERDGVWVLCAQYLDNGHWETADSIGGFIGDDFKNSGYDMDLKQSALIALGIKMVDRAWPRTF